MQALQRGVRGTHDRDGLIATAFQGVGPMPRRVLALYQIMGRRENEQETRIREKRRASSRASPGRVAPTGGGLWRTV